MAEGNIQIVLVDPGAVTTDSFGGAQRAEVRHTVWAQRRDIAGFQVTEQRAVSAEAEVVFRVKDLEGIWGGIRPTVDWKIIDQFDNNREYRIVRVHRVMLRGAARSPYLDLYGSFRGATR